VAIALTWSNLNLPRSLVNFSLKIIQVSVCYK